MGVVFIQDLLAYWIANPGIVAIVTLRSRMRTHPSDETIARLIFVLLTRGCILMLLAKFGTSGKAFFFAYWGSFFLKSSSSTPATLRFPLSTGTSHGSPSGLQILILLLSLKLALNDLAEDGISAKLIITIRIIVLLHFLPHQISVAHGTRPKRIQRLIIWSKSKLPQIVIPLVNELPLLAILQDQGIQEDIIVNVRRARGL